MMTKNTQIYLSMISKLFFDGCKVFHFITYRKNKICNKSFEDILNTKLCLPNKFVVDKIIIENDNNKYVLYNGNNHHWTTNFVWNNFLPIMFSRLNVNFIKDDFIEIPFIWNNCNFSYHNMLNSKFKIWTSSKNEEIGDHEILRITNDCPSKYPAAISFYHSLFKLNHMCGRISNISDSNLITLNRVVVNCDSMSIPVIPILACYCKEMFVIDNRTGKSHNLVDQIIKFKPTHYISLFTEENFLFTQKYIKQIL